MVWRMRPWSTIADTAFSKWCCSIMSGVPKMARVNINSQCSDTDFGISCRASIGAWDSISTIAPCGATAATIIPAMAGTAKHVLVVGAETHSAALDLSAKGRTVASLFGDGAGAVVVSATDEDRGIRGTYLGADGRFADVLSQRVWDIKKRPFVKLDENGVGQVPPDDLWARMDGKQVFRNAVERMIGVLMQACADQGLTRDDIDLFFFHQANLRINQYIAQQIGITEDKLVSNIQRYGNTTAATIPILLAEAEQSGRLKRGMKVAMVAFGSGFTWGAAIVDW